MTQQSLQSEAGSLAYSTLAALNANFSDLYAYFGVAAGNPFAVNYFVDGDRGSDNYNGLTPTTAKATIGSAITAAGAGDRIFIKPLEAESGDTDPDSYAEALTIPATKGGLSLIGCGRGLSQGGQPQIKPGAGTDPLLTVNAFGVGVFNLTFNGAGATGGGVKLVADGSAKDAGGFISQGCQYKNCKGSAAAATGGGIYWSSYGGSWYVSIYGNEFIDCRAGIVLTGTSGDSPRHVKIVGNRFGSAVNTTVDADIYGGGSGWIDVIINDNTFATVDVPAYASSPDAARYIKMLGGSGIISKSTFACVVDPAGTEKTFGASGTACIVPTTFRMAALWGEGVAATADQSIAGRT